MVDETFVKRFRKKAKTLAALDHPNIVTIYNMGEVDGRVFIAMEYLAGSSLKQNLEKDGPILFDETVRIMSEICDGLQTLMSRG